MTRVADVRASEEEAKIKESAIKQAAAKKAQIARDLNEAFSTSAGLHALRYIMELCQWERSSVIGDQNGNPLPEGTIYNAAQQNIYRNLRKLIKKETLILVEFKGLASDEEVDILS